MNQDKTKDFEIFKEGLDTEYSGRRIKTIWNRLEKWLSDVQPSTSFTLHNPPTYKEYVKLTQVEVLVESDFFGKVVITLDMIPMLFLNSERRGSFIVQMGLFESSLQKLRSLHAKQIYNSISGGGMDSPLPDYHYALNAFLFGLSKKKGDKSNGKRGIKFDVFNPEDTSF